MTSGKLRALLAPLEKLVAQRRHTQLIEAAQALLKMLPAHPYVLKALSFGLIGEGRQADAIPVLEQALRISGKDPELHNNLGICLSAVLRWDEAVACFDSALALRGMDPQTWMNRGIAFCLMNRWDEGIPSLVKAIELHPGDYDEAIEWLAAALINAGRNDEALACYQELHREDPDNPGYLGALVSAWLRTGNWAGLAAAVESLRTLSADFTRPAIGPWHALCVPGITAPELRRIAEAHAGIDPSSRVRSIEAVATAPQLATKQRLRVGYLSYDFRSGHPVAGVVPHVFELHDRSRVEVFAYSLAADDGSEIRRRLVAACDRFVDVSGLGIEATAKRIAGDGIDILVDLQGWTTGGRPAVLAHRAAPVQVNWLGYAGTMGGPRLADYLLGDAIVTPPQDAGCYSERIERLPHCYLPMDAAQVIGETPTRRDAGLPEDDFVFCSLNSSYKFNPQVFDIWCRLLREVPQSCLWLSRPAGSGAENLLREVAARDVAPSRIIYAERVAARADYLARLRLADLVLDPFPYNSHSTGMDALWAGVPMIALLGETFAGRVGASMLMAAGLPECVARSGEEYLQRCLALAGDPGKLRELRQRLAANHATSPLFDMPRFTRDLEDAYFRMGRDAAAASAA